MCAWCNRGEDRGRRWTRWKRITPTVPRDPGLGGETSRRKEGSGGGQWVRAQARGEAGPQVARERAEQNREASSAGKKERRKKGLTGGVEVLEEERNGSGSLG
jgi:hypothetical protein